MTIDLQQMIERTVSEDAGAVPDLRAVQRRANRRRRRRVAGRGLGGVALVALIVAAGVQIRGGIRGGDGVEISAGRGAGSIDVTAADLSGRAVELALPDSIGAGYTVVEQTTGISLAGGDWLLVATRGDGTGAPTTCGGRVGAWTVEFSGDGMTAGACAVLQAELEQFEATDDGLRYIGASSLQPSDSPDVVATTDTAQLSVFHRPCHLAGTLTAGGLVMTKVDDPARGSTLTVLCDAAAGVEVWIDAPDRPSDIDLDMVTVAAPSPAGSPRFLPAPGWEISRAGLTAANIPLGPDSLAGTVPWDTVERLEDGDVVLFVMLVPAGESSAVDAIFPPRELPLSLDDGRPGGLEGQPDGIYAERLLAQVDGWNIDLLVFYGGQGPTGVPPVASAPTAETRAAVQEQLARLVVPARETPN